MIKLFAIPVICSVMSGPVMKDVSYHHEYGPQQAVIYDDEEYQIVFEIENELFSYTWNNLNNAFATNPNNYNWENMAFYASNDGIVYSPHQSEEIYVVDGSSYIYFNFTYVNNGDVVDSFYFNYDADADEPDNKFYTEYTLAGSTLASYETIALGFLDENSYEYIKSAIQADIQANQTSSMPSIQDLFAQVTSAINAFIGSLGDAFTQVTALFWDSTATTPGPTFLGLLVLIGVGVGLVYAAYRVIKGLLHRI